MTGNPTTEALPSAAEVEASLIELVAEIQGRDCAAVAAAMSVTGGIALDSLDAVEILVSLEGRFGIRFPDDAVAAEALETVDGLATYVLRLVAVRT